MVVKQYAHAAAVTPLNKIEINTRAMWIVLKFKQKAIFSLLIGIENVRFSERNSQNPFQIRENIR
jgi:hypothetical protein